MQVVLMLTDVVPGQGTSSVFITKVECDSETNVLKFTAGPRSEAQVFRTSLDKELIKELARVALNHDFDTRDTHYIGFLVVSLV